ncbi:Predicted oxidoreductase of the aldo/keto reductase family [Proteiniborus ethanoligenes]|uniref:Predicted oxidoreductase of the aldo/keto reductase family n=1 Tax=Proteiniborus ethanoligenes TaxID=415015 RepID=A0A1H3R758_9FIRM|nr:aldo/keto reductase [Proteiniborus ethanoligenes]SDZ21614.1 Predicted oxidoreductase of the aldo/keto reductase family [Proteiniborus ethanoligenes]
MIKRLLGRTGLEISIIGFGGIPIQRLDKESAVILIEELYKQGINFIDTARGYTTSEELIGHGLKKIGRDKFILATKSMSRDYESMKRDIQISLNNLKTDYIELYQVHNVRTEEEYSKILSEDGALKALLEAKEKGSIKHIGITSHDLNIIEKGAESGHFSTIQFPYNPVERQAEELFKRAKELGLGVIVMKPLAGGAIINKELSLRFVLENNNISVAIPGMDSVEQIITNSKLGIEYRSLNDEERAIILSEAKELGSEFCRRCGYCAPCPQRIDIPVQFLMEGYYTRYNLKDWAKERYLSMENKAVDCIECGICETRCPYDLPIRRMLKKVAYNLG